MLSIWSSQTSDFIGSSLMEVLSPSDNEPRCRALGLSLLLLHNEVHAEGTLGGKEQV